MKLSFSPIPCMSQAGRELMHMTIATTACHRSLTSCQNEAHHNMIVRFRIRHVTRSERRNLIAIHPLSGTICVIIRRTCADENTTEMFVRGEHLFRCMCIDANCNLTHLSSVAVLMLISFSK